MHPYKCLHFPQTYTAYFTQQILIQTRIKQSAKYTNCNKETSANINTYYSGFIADITYSFHM
jgi:hypothetical protein